MSARHAARGAPAARLSARCCAQHGFSVAPEQTVSFLQRGRTARARAPSRISAAPRSPRSRRHPEQRDALRRAVRPAFSRPCRRAGSTTSGERDDEMQVQDDSAPKKSLIGEDINETGQAATASGSPRDARFARARRCADAARDSPALPARLPRRRGYRHKAARRGKGIDLARRLRAAIRTDGEVIEPARQRRAMRPRPILLLIDVSGSMKQRTDAHLRFAHALVHAAPRVEVFTFGTRLTRADPRAAAEESRAGACRRGRPRRRLGWRHADRRCAGRLPRGAALCRLMPAARCVIVLSDGLERGDPDADDPRGAASRGARLVGSTG